MNKRKIITTIIILSIIISGLAMYIAYDKFNDWQIKNQQNIFKAGVLSGKMEWNDLVVNTVNTEDRIPYILNNSIYFTPIKQICERLN